MTGWQACLRNLLMLCICFFNIVLPYWHEHDVEEHAVSHLECHAHNERHLHRQTEDIKSHDHDHCAICQSALNHVFTFRQPNFKVSTEKITLRIHWAPVREFVARVALPIHPQAP